MGFNKLFHLLPGKKTDFILATVRVEIDKKMVPLSQYLTWTNRDFITDPVEHMLEEVLVDVDGEITKRPATIPI